MQALKPLDAAFTRRAFLGAAALIVGASALPAHRLAAAPSGAAGGDDGLIEQIVALYGGWDFDQDTAEKALARAPSQSDLPKDLLVYLRRSHAMQAAMQAEQDGADPPMIVAALLHDLGHFFAPPAPAGLADYDDMHALYGSLWLRNVFVPEVSEPIAQHVPAKRYLVATRPEYVDVLSAGSRRSLALQGGQMSRAEVEAFELQAYFREGVQVRLWDDRAKAKGVELPTFERYARHLAVTRKPRGA